jgi:hypothetical protein
MISSFGDPAHGKESDDSHILNKLCGKKDWIQQRDPLHCFYTYYILSNDLNPIIGNYQKNSITALEKDTHKK